MALFPLADRHAALGAVMAPGVGVELPRRYADVAAEYRAVHDAVGVVDRADLAVVRLWGRDPVRMLHGLVTNDLVGAPADRAVYAAMLTPKGRMIADLRALRRPGEAGPEVLALLAREALAATTEHLKKFVPPMFARWADASAETGVLGVYGPRAAALLGLVLDAPAAELAEDDVRAAAFGAEPVTLVGTRYAGVVGADVVASAAALPALWDALLARGAALGAAPVGHAALETLRIEAGRPRYGAELTEETIPTEAYEATGQMARAVSFTKGCYTGQEVIVRIAHRGHVNRHLRGFLLGDAPAPPPRTPLFHPETAKQIGWTTSAAASPLAGGTVALGYVRREVEPGAVVRVGSADGATARVVATPFAAAAAG